MRRALVRSERWPAPQGSSRAQLGRRARAVLGLAVACGVAMPVAAAAADAGPWGWPLDGPHEVSRPFAPPASVYGAGHRGADLPSRSGAPVRASAAGRVTYAGLLAGRGVLVVTHGALRTTYEPVRAAVAVGDDVGLGEVVGQLEPGHVGCPVEACLHWGLRRGEHYLDPVRLVERGPVRLLPTGGGPGSRTTARGGVAGEDPVPWSPSGPAQRADALRNALAATSASSAGALPAEAPEVGARGSTAVGGDRRAAAAGGSEAADRPDEPMWSLRADEAPLGAAAVAALVVGIGLLAAPRPPRPGPPPPAVPPAAGAPLSPPGPATATPRLAQAALAAQDPARPGVDAPAAAAVDVGLPGPPSPGSAPGEPAAVSQTAPLAAVLELAAERERRRPA